MGDHRASIKINMEFHGVKDKCDMWINYFPEDCCHMDRRVTEFFESVYDRGMEKYNEIMEEAYAEQHKQEIESTEKAELARLEKKYKPGKQ